METSEFTTIIEIGNCLRISKNDNMVVIEDSLAGMSTINLEHTGVSENASLLTGATILFQLALIAAHKIYGADLKEVLKVAHKAIDDLEMFKQIIEWSSEK